MILPSMSTYHIPVMLNEVLDYLNVKKDSWYIDCNLGGGGHTEGILKKGGNVLGIDLDNDAISEVQKKLSKYILSKNLILKCNNFSYVQQIVTGLGLSGIRGILFDLGVSSYQLETPNRGFSFNLDAPLDMRMDQSSNSPKASDLLKVLSEKELSELFWKLGEERFARQIARKIVEVRKQKSIETTNDLVRVILSVRHRSPNDKIHPATRVFQALRIAVNDELNSLREALPQALDILEKGGRIVVISFHSLEDRIVKNFFKDHSSRHPERSSEGSIKILTRKPIEPTEEEIIQNPRARSGKLRVAERL